MGSKIRGVPEAAPLSDEGDPTPEPSIGRYLARQRSMRGISVEELAAMTRIPRRSLERLESGHGSYHGNGGITRDETL